MSGSKEISQKLVPEESVYTRRNDLKIGDVVADRYEILSILGEGGMGLVYKARHKLMNRMVALKVIRAELVSNLTLMQRFQQEAMAVSKLQHPNIVTVYDFGVTEDGLPFLVMDYLDGNSLAEMIGKFHRLSVDTAVEIFFQACYALAHAHENGIIHRDFKSSNLMICDIGGRMVVKVVDFGMAKLMRPSEDSTQIMELTQTGEVFGSPLYMSPEQCRGQALDQRSDIYSLACVIYYALTGQPPLLGENVLDTLQKQIHDPPLPMSDITLGIPANLESVIQKALRKDPDTRYQNVAELLVDLQAVAAGRERVLVTAQMKKPTEKELLEHSGHHGGYEPRKKTLFSHNFEMNVIAVLLLALGCIAMTAYMTGRMVENENDQEINLWVDHSHAGDALREQGKYAGAEAQYKMAIAEAQKFGKNDPRLAKSLVSLGTAYIDDNQYTRAETQLKRAITVLEKCYGKDCPESGSPMLLLSRSYAEQGKKKEAAAVRQKAIALMEGSTHLDAAKPKTKRR
jgi:serine/threonine protein kinase